MIMLCVAVLAILGRGVIPAGTPFLKADDLGLTRGDGIFETIHVRDCQPWLLDEHLDRLQASAEKLDLPQPPRAELVALAEQACAAWREGEEGALKIVFTRGPETTGEPTCFATLTPVPATAIAARDNGIAVRLLSLGYPATARPEAPWLLPGAKTLSYAINMATLRHARANGADDALWISSDGYLLEAPTASLVWRSGGELLTVPPSETGVLPGITARFALDHAPALGLRPSTRMITPPELLDVDGAWLLSSVRGIAPINTIDGEPMRTSADTPRLRAVLGF